METGLAPYKAKTSYWILTFPDYGSYVFYGTEKEAQEEYIRKTEWERQPGVLRRADPGIKKDWELVNQEINNVMEDRACGIKGLPFLPREDGF